MQGRPASKSPNRRKPSADLRLVHRSRRRSVKGTIHQGEALYFLQSLDDESANIVFLDPPFNLGKKYSHTKNGLDQRPTSDYMDWQNAILKESARILTPGGSLFLYHLPLWAMRLGAQIDSQLTFRHWIAISMKNGFARGTKLYPAHYALLYFTKGSPKVFQRPRIPPLTCRHCDGLVRDYGGYTDIIEEKGVNVSDIWDDLSPVRHPANKTRPQNELPAKLYNRILDICGAPGLTYVDPFAGSGGGVVAAATRGLRFKACDIVRANCTLIRKRIEQLP